MSIYLQGVTFAEQEVTPADDGAACAARQSDGVLTGCTMSAVGSTLTLGAGLIIACGRIVRVAAAQSIPVTGALSGYARLRLTLDMSATATETEFYQVRLDVDYASSRDGFDTLTQQDVNAGGTVYQMVLCVVSLSSAGISGIVSRCGPSNARLAQTQVLLDKDDWSGGSQTVSVDGVHSGTAVFYSSGSEATREAYLAADVHISAQGEGTLTFLCASTPAVDIPVNIALG